jgi:two-component system phosphate regulon sensor histidine kinase PhoR
VLRHGDKVSEDRCIEALNRERAPGSSIDQLLDWGRMESGRRVAQSGQSTMSADHRRGDQRVRADAKRPPRRGVVIALLSPEAAARVVRQKSALVDSLVNTALERLQYGGQPRRIDISTRMTEKSVHHRFRKQWQGASPAASTNGSSRVLPASTNLLARQQRKQTWPRHRAARNARTAATARGR